MRGRRLWQVPWLSTKVLERVEAAGQCFSKYHSGGERGGQHKKTNKMQCPQSLSHS